MAEAHYKKGVKEGRWVRAIESNRVFDSISMAARTYGITPQAIRKSINTGCCAGGAHWEDLKFDDRPKVLRPTTPWSVYGRKRRPSKPFKDK